MANRAESGLSVVTAADAWLRATTLRSVRGKARGPTLENPLDRTVRHDEDSVTWCFPYPQPP